MSWEIKFEVFEYLISIIFEVVFIRFLLSQMLSEFRTEGKVRRGECVLLLFLKIYILVGGNTIIFIHIYKI